MLGIGLVVKTENDVTLRAQAPLSVRIRSWTNRRKENFIQLYISINLFKYSFFLKFLQTLFPSVFITNVQPPPVQPVSDVIWQ